MKRHDLLNKTGHKDIDELFERVNQALIDGDNLRIEIDKVRKGASTSVSASVDRLVQQDSVMEYNLGYIRDRSEKNFIDLQLFNERQRLDLLEEHKLLIETTVSYLRNSPYLIPGRNSMYARELEILLTLTKKRIEKARIRKEELELKKSEF